MLKVMVNVKYIAEVFLKKISCSDFEKIF